MKKFKSILFLVITVMLIFLGYGSSNQVNASNIETKNSTADYSYVDKDTLLLHNLNFTTSDLALLEQFRNVTNLKIDTSEPILTISLSSALAYFPNTVKLYIPAYITTINFWEEDCFPYLEEFVVAEENSVYASIQGVLYNKSKDTLIQYPYNGKREAIVEAGTKIIGFHSFYNIPIHSIQIPNGVVVIENYAFAKTKLTEISLPSTFHTIGSSSFEGSTIQKVNISENNPSLISIDGVVYRKDKSFLYYWPEGKVAEQLILPNELLFLDCKEIKNFSKVKQFTVPDSLTAMIGTEENQIEQIRMKEDQKHFNLYDGVLYSKDFSKIKLYPNQNTDTEIVLHSNLEDFPMDFFYTENSTKKLTLPTNLKNLKGKQYSIYRILLSGFSNLSELKMEGNNEFFHLNEGVLYNKDMTSILWYPIDLPQKEFIILDTITQVENDQLVIQNHIEKLVVPEQCLLFDFSPYQSFDVTLNEMLVGRDCKNLKAFVVDSKNPYYYEKDGVLFSRDRKELLLYPSNKKDKVYQIPNGVTKAVFGNQNAFLESLYLPSTFSDYAINYVLDGDHFNFSDGLLHYTSLKEVIVDSTNQNFLSLDGVFYSNSSNSKTLLAYPVAKTNPSFYLPKEVNRILNPRYFESNQYLQNMYINRNSPYQKIENNELYLESNKIHFTNLHLQNSN